MTAPTLFVLAADLTKMQVVANLDESDVGRIRPGQAVTFRVDAYPTETFTGTSRRCACSRRPCRTSSTYPTVIDVPNPELKLKPGMTANVNIEIARRDERRCASRTRRCGSGRPTDDLRGAQPGVPPEISAARVAAADAAARRRAPGGQPGAQPGAAARRAAWRGTPATPPAAARPRRSPPQRQQRQRRRSRRQRGCAEPAAAADPQGRPRRRRPACGARRRGGGGGTAARRVRSEHDAGRAPQADGRAHGEHDARRARALRGAHAGTRRRVAAAAAAAAGGGQRRQPAGRGAKAADAAATRPGRQRRPQRDPRRGITAASRRRVAPSGATTIDALFAPLRDRRHAAASGSTSTSSCKSVRSASASPTARSTEIIDGDVKEGHGGRHQHLTGLEPTNRPGQTGTGQPAAWPAARRPGRRSAVAVAATVAAAAGRWRSRTSWLS